MLPDTSTTPVPPPKGLRCRSSFECADLARDPSFSDSAPFAGNRIFRVAGPLASTPTDSFPGIGGESGGCIQWHKSGKEGVRMRKWKKHIKIQRICQISHVNFIWWEKTTLRLKIIENRTNLSRLKRSFNKVNRCGTSMKYVKLTTGLVQMEFCCHHKQTLQSSGSRSISQSCS